MAAEPNINARSTINAGKCCILKKTNVVKQSGVLNDVKLKTN